MRCYLSGFFVAATALFACLSLEGFLTLRVVSIELHLEVVFKRLFHLLWQRFNAFEALVALPDSLGQTGTRVAEKEVKAWVIVVRP